jgi:hypothetical protein
VSVPSKMVLSKEGVEDEKNGRKGKEGRIQCRWLIKI